MSTNPRAIEDHRLAELATPLPAAAPGRTWKLVWPREHGAWGMLLVPLITGAAVGVESLHAMAAVALFAAAAVALFCLRVPVEIWLETSPLRAQTDAERQTLASFISIYAAAAFAAIGVLFAMGYERGLLLIGAVAALAFGAQTLLRRAGRSTRMISQVVGTIGLSSTAAGAYFVATHRLDERAVLLWAVNWIFAGNQVHFVQLRIHAARAATFVEKFARGWSFLFGELISVLAIAAAWRWSWITPWTAIAFVPVLVRGTLWFFSGRRPLAVRRLGLEELAQSVFFGLAIICSFRLP